MSNQCLRVTNNEIKIRLAGKYSDFKHIRDDNSVTLKKSPKMNGGGGGGDVITDSDANRRLDEITPLLHQASISATSHETTTTNHINTDTIAVNGNARIAEVPSMHHKSSSSKSHHHHNSSSSTIVNGNTAGKVVYRKRFKKSGRKISSYNVSESNLSDSDRN